MTQSNSTFEVAGHKYQAGKLDMFDQMIIAKRLMPVMKNIVTPEIIQAVLASSAVPGETQEQADAAKASMKVDASKMLPAIADAIYSLSDEDTRTIVQLALSGVHRQNKGGAFSPLMAPGGGLLFQDVTMPTMLQIAWKVIEVHLGDFFATAP